MTYHLADEAFFGKLARRPLLINTSRGEIVDTGAVKMAITQGRISGYVADVWEHEPGLDLELLQMTSIGTPHIAGYSVEGKANGTAACVQAASRYFGFGIDRWQPQFLPPPPNPRIKILSTGKTDDEIISEALLAAYNILKDDENLKKDPGAFEKLRNYYPIRREYEAFTIKLTEYRPDAERKLRELGFQM
jgi:erythronate-4-phosphate dehydrogenase